MLAFGVLGDQDTDEAGGEGPSDWPRSTTSAGVGRVGRGPGPRAQGHGTLVVLSSVAGERVRRANFIYGSSKAGLDGFAQGLGDALTGSGARVLIVRPGFVRTKMTEGRPTVPLSTTADAVAPPPRRPWPTAGRWSGSRRPCARCSPCSATCPDRCGAGCRLRWRRASDEMADQ